MKGWWIPALLLAISSAAETIIVDGGDVRNIGQAYAMLNTADGEFDTILITLDTLAEPRPVTINGVDSLTIQALRPCRITAPNRLDLFRITARSKQELVLANLNIQPAWLPPRPDEVKRKHRSVEAMHAALRITLSSELHNFSLELRDLAISASREDRSAVPLDAAFSALDWHYRNGITIAGLPKESENNRIQLSGCEISHVTESGLRLRSDHAIQLEISNSLFVQANRQGLWLDARNKQVVITHTRIAFCNTGMWVSGAASSPWSLKHCLFVNNRADGIKWTTTDLKAQIEASTFFANGSLFGAAHSSHSSGDFSFTNCIFAGAGHISPGESTIRLNSCNLVLAGPHSMRGRHVPFPSDSEIKIVDLLVDDPRFASTDPFTDSAFAVTHDGYKALGLTGFAKFAGGSPGVVSVANPDDLDVARRRSAAPSERDAANWAWRYRISGKSLYLDRAEAHFWGFLDVLEGRLAKKADYALAIGSARQACFAALELRAADRLKAADEAPLVKALGNGLSTWSAESNEHFPIGRALLDAAGCAMVAKAFPDQKQANALTGFANSAWDEWQRVGLLSASALDQMAGLHGLLDLAYGLDREAELVEQVARFRELVVLVDNVGFRHSPADFYGQTNAAGVRAYWRDELPGGASSDATAPWSRLAWLCKDAEFAHAAAKVAGSGQEAAAVDALIAELALDPESPATLSRVTRMGNFANRMVLAPKRGIRDSYLGAWLYERGNAYVNAHPDQLGAIYSFSSDGAILLGHGNRRSAGTRNANTLVVHPPKTSNWQHNSASLAMMAGQFPSKNWATAITQTRTGPRAMWTPFGDPTRGHAEFNPDGYVGLTDTLALDSLYLEISRPSLSRNELAALGTISVRLKALSLVGDKGSDAIHGFASLEGLELLRKVTERQDDGQSGVREEALDADIQTELWSVVEDEEQGTCLEVTLPPSEAGLLLKVSDLDRRFDIRDDYDRLTFSHRFLGERPPSMVIYPNAHVKPRYNRGVGLGQPSTWPGRNQGGQIRGAEASMKNGDAWGHFTATNCFGAGSRWSREIVVAAEGFAVVRDNFVAGDNLAGFDAGPVWHLGGKSPQPQGKGFVGEAFAKAWWQEGNPQLFVLLYGGESGTQGRAVFAHSALASGEPARFISVLVPFTEASPSVSVVGDTVTVGERVLQLPKETP